MFQISLKMNDMTSFAVTSLSDNILQCSDELKVALNPEESFQVVFEFIPENYGTTFCSIPVFVDKFSKSQAFNHLKLKGEYTQPRMNSSKRAIYFTPTSAGTREIREFSIDLIAHQCDMKVDVEYDKSLGIQISLLDCKVVSDLKAVLQCKAVFTPKEGEILISVFLFSPPASKAVHFY